MEIIVIAIEVVTWVFTILFTFKRGCVQYNSPFPPTTKYVHVLTAGAHRTSSVLWGSHSVEGECNITGMDFVTTVMLCHSQEFFFFWQLHFLNVILRISVWGEKGQELVLILYGRPSRIKLLTQAPNELSDPFVRVDMLLFQCASIWRKWFVAHNWVQHVNPNFKSGGF